VLAKSVVYKKIFGLSSGNGEILALCECREKSKGGWIMVLSRAIISTGRPMEKIILILFQIFNVDSIFLKETLRF